MEGERKKRISTGGEKRKGHFRSRNWSEERYRVRKALGPERRVWWKHKRRQDTSEQRTVGRGSRGSEASLESTLTLGYWASEPHFSHSLKGE